MREQLEQNRIFFSADLCDKIESILLDSHEIIVEMFMAKKNEQRNDNYNRRGLDVSVKDLLNPSDTWHELDEKVRRKLRLLRLDLAQEFRTLIGVS